MEKILDPAVMSKIMMILSVIGAVLVGLPAVLRALEAIFILIPGDEPDKMLAKLRAGSEKIADLLSKLYPKPKA